MKPLNNLVYGTWSGYWGRKSKYSPPNKYEKECTELLRYALENGISEIDTAEMYGGGYAETIIGKVIQNYSRESLKINSKIKGTNLDINKIRPSIEGSLKRLKTDYLDTYFIHWLNKEIDIKDSLTTLLKLKEEGLFKKIGISNFNFSEVNDIYPILEKENIALQLEYNYSKRNNGNIRNVENEIIPYCKNHGIDFYAYNPMDGVINSPDSILRSLSKKYGKSIAQLSLMWLLSKDIKVIFGTSNVLHLKENIDLGAIIKEFE